MSSLPQYDDEEDAPQRAQHRRSEEEWLYSGDGDDMGNSFASVPAQFEMDLKGSEEGEEEEQEQKQKQRQKRSGRFAFSKPIGYMHRAHGFDDNFNSKNADLDNPIPRREQFGDSACPTHRPSSSTNCKSILATMQRRTWRPMWHCALGCSAASKTDFTH